MTTHHDHTFRMDSNARRRHLMKDHAGEWSASVWGKRLGRPMSDHLAVVIRNLHNFVHEKTSVEVGRS